MNVDAGLRARLPGLDVARGLAVLGMTWMHLVPSEGPGAGPWLARALDGKAAALFFLLAGMGWRLEEMAHGGGREFVVYRLRRAAGLAAAGLVLHASVWTTEVLVPMALMLVSTILLRSSVARLFSALLAVGLGLVLPAWDPRWMAGDWHDDGGHAMDSWDAAAWARGLLVDGNYPWAPWWALVCAGGILAERWADATKETPSPGLWRSGWTTGFGGIGIGVAVAGAGVLAAKLGEALGGRWSMALGLTWVPTTLPFLMVAGGWASAVVALCLRWEKPWAWLVGLGRQSLTLYVGHLVLVVLPLRGVWPGDDWPVGVGLEAWFWWTTVSGLWAGWWMARGRKRGPLEVLLAMVSGPKRSGLGESESAVSDSKFSESKLSEPGG